MEADICGLSALVRNVWLPPPQIDKKQKSLERCQSLEEIQRLFEAGDYGSVVRLLRPTLSSLSARAKALEFASSAPERPAQLLLLQVQGMLGG